MKLKTMLRFLLCFLIIGSFYGVFQTNADEGCIHQCSTGYTYQELGNGTHKEVGKCDLCGVIVETIGHCNLPETSADMENNYIIKPLSGGTYHSIIRKCDKCTYTENKTENCALTITYSPQNDGTHLKRSGSCAICGKLVQDVKVKCQYLEYTEYKSNNNGTHFKIPKCRDCGVLGGESTWVKQNCDTNGSRTISQSAGDSKYHYVQGSCDKCDYIHPQTHSSCAIVITGTNNGSTGYKCTECGKTWVGTAATSGGPSASDFFDAGKTSELTSAMGLLEGEMGPIYHIQSLIMFFGTLVAVIIVLIYAIQWMTATSQKRQELKAGMWPLILGIMILVLAPRLIPIIYNALEMDGTKESPVTMVEHTNTVAGTIINVVQTLGYMIAIVMILVVGIQYLIAVPNKKQELKARMINIMIGAILLVGGVSILDWIADIAKNDMKHDAMLPQEVVEEWRA